MFVFGINSDMDIEEWPLLFEKWDCVSQHKKVLRIMRKNHILSKVRRKKKKYINGSPSSIGERTLYLSTIIDTFNREIISCIISESQTLTLAMKTLKQAMRGRKIKNVLLHSGSRKYSYSKRISSVCQRKRHDHQHVPERKLPW